MKTNSGKQRRHAILRTCGTDRLNRTFDRCIHTGRSLKGLSKAEREFCVMALHTHAGTMTADERRDYCKARHLKAVFGYLTDEDARPTLWGGRPRPRLCVQFCTYNKSVKYAIRVRCLVTRRPCATYANSTGTRRTPLFGHRRYLATFSHLETNCNAAEFMRKLLEHFRKLFIGQFKGRYKICICYVSVITSWC